MEVKYSLSDLIMILVCIVIIIASMNQMIASSHKKAVVEAKQEIYQSHSIDTVASNKLIPVILEKKSNGKKDSIYVIPDELLVDEPQVRYNTPNGMEANLFLLDISTMINHHRFKSVHFLCDFDGNVLMTLKYLDNRPSDHIYSLYRNPVNGILSKKHANEKDNIFNITLQDKIASKVAAFCH